MATPNSNIAKSVADRKVYESKVFDMTEHPMDKLHVLQMFANQKGEINTDRLINTLLSIIDGLHTRICNLDEKVAVLEKRR